MLPVLYGQNKEAVCTKSSIGELRLKLNFSEHEFG